MLTINQLKQALHREGITKTDACLLCVAACDGVAASTSAIKRLAMEAGFKGAKSVNYSAHLHSAEDKAFKTPSGWELTDNGKKYVAGLVSMTNFSDGNTLGTPIRLATGANASNEPSRPHREQLHASTSPMSIWTS